MAMATSTALPGHVRRVSPEPELSTDGAEKPTTGLQDGLLLDLPPPILV
jgi:hypothetical protein